jgi:hypothetical protein
MKRGLALLGAVGGAVWLVVLMAGSTQPVTAGRQALPLDVVLIEALYYDAYEYLQVDEAFRLVNVSSTTAYLGDWGVGDQEATALFPPGTTLAPGQALWCA